MRRYLLLVTISITGLCLAASPLLTFKVIDEPFHSAVKMIEEKAGVKILVLSPIEKRVSLEANKAALSEVLNALTSQVSARWEEGYLVSTQKTKKPRVLGGPLVSISFDKGTPLSDALQALEKESKIRILVNPNVKGTTNALSFKNQRIERIIDRLCSSAGVYWEKVYIITKPTISLNLDDFSQVFGGEGEEVSPASGPQRFMENYQRFLQLSPEERVNLMSNLFDRLFSLPPEQRDGIIQNVAVFLSNAVNAFLSLPPERQSQVASFAEPIISAGVRAYFRLPEDKRRLLQPWVDAFAPLEGYSPPR